MSKRSSRKKIHPPFGYFGSKNRIAQRLSSKLPPHNCWVEAFCGSAALTFRKEPAAIEVINDIDNEIVNLFEQLRTNHEELFRSVLLTPYAEEELLSARKKSKRLSKVERARRFLVQSMMAVNGVFGKERGGFSYSDSYSRNGYDARVSRWNNLLPRLESVVNRLKGIRIENRDARRLLKKYLRRPATLIYLDPPYLGDRTNGYSIDANDEQFHKELLRIANRAKCMIFISGYENDLYDSVLTSKKGWSKKTIKATTKGSNGQSLKRTEVVWMNKYFTSAQKLGKVPIVLTKRELSQGKVNPERRQVRLPINND